MKKVYAGLLCLIVLCMSIMQPFSHIESYAFTERAGVVSASNLNVRSGAGTSYAKQAGLVRGMPVKVLDEVQGNDGNTWYRISYQSGGSTKTGYVLKNYIHTGEATSTYSHDAAFEASLTAQGFPEDYKVKLREIHAKYPNWVFKAQHTGLSWDTVIKEESLVGRNLVHSSSLSSWKSIANGAYNWETSTWPGFDTASWVAASEGIIRYYMDPRNFLDTTYIFQFLHHEYNESKQKASGVEAMVASTFMKSANSSIAGTGGNGMQSSTGTSTAPLANGSKPPTTTQKTDAQESGNNDGVFFKEPPASIGSGVKLQSPGSKGDVGPGLSLNYDIVYRLAEIGPGMTGGPGVSSGSTANTAVSTVSSNTDSSIINASGIDYVSILMNAAKKAKVNPYVLAAMIIQEQGNSGTSGLISGKTTPYIGIYNYFNIEAYATSTMTPVQRGLWWASQAGSYGRPWNSVEKAITGGAIYYGENYVSAGQDTFYLKKFNVQGNNLYKHQYMTNIQGAANEGAKLASAYSDILKAEALEFKIPVYTNMPTTPEVMPSGDGNPNNKLASLSAGEFALSPAFHRDTVEYTLRVPRSAGSVYISANAVSSLASIEGGGNIDMNNPPSKVEIKVKAQNGNVRVYTIYIQREGGTAPGGDSVVVVAP